MIDKREKELQSLIKEHADTQELYKHKTSNIVAATITDTNDEDQDGSASKTSRSHRRLRQKIIKVGSVEEVQLDLSMIKMHKRRSSKSNSRRSPYSSKSRSAGSKSKSASSKSGRRTNSKKTSESKKSSERFQQAAQD